MKTKYRENMMKGFRWIPNGLIHLILILFIPIYFIGLLSAYSLKELALDWWDDFNSFYVWRKKK